MFGVFAVAFLSMSFSVFSLSFLCPFAGDFSLSLLGLFSVVFAGTFMLQSQLKTVANFLFFTARSLVLFGTKSAENININQLH